MLTAWATELKRRSLEFAPLLMPNRTEPKTVGEWIRYLVVAVIAIWLIIWMLRISGIDIL